MDKWEIYSYIKSKDGQVTIDELIKLANIGEVLEGVIEYSIMAEYSDCHSHIKFQD